MATLYVCLRLDSRRLKGSNALYVSGAAGCGGRVFETALSTRRRLLLESRVFLAVSVSVPGSRWGSKLAVGQY